MLKISSETRSLTVEQRVILARETRLWPTSILEDGAVLCLDRDKQRAGGLDQDDDWTPMAWILTKTGSLLSVYHYYAKYHGFTYLEPKQRTEQERAPIPLESRVWLTILEVIDYLAATYDIKRSKSAVSRWLRVGLVSSKMGTVAGHFARLVDRRSLDAYILGGRIRQPGNNKRSTA